MCFASIHSGFLFLKKTAIERLDDDLLRGVLMKLVIFIVFCSIAFGAQATYVPDNDKILASQSLPKFEVIEIISGESSQDTRFKTFTETTKASFYEGAHGKDQTFSVIPAECLANEKKVGT